MEFQGIKETWDQEDFSNKRAGDIAMPKTKI
jgi:hypothetical protein